MSVVFDTTFCGVYGDALWPNDAVCKGLASTCEEYVAGNPGAYTDA